ncbi:MAG: hypothetical protein ABFD63_09480 [Smithella sp.]
MEKKALSKVTGKLIAYNAENAMQTGKLPNVPNFMAEKNGKFFEHLESSDVPSAIWQLHQAIGYDAAQYKQIFGNSADNYGLGDIRQLCRISIDEFAPEEV